MGKDESELVPMNKEPGYGGTDAEESKKPEIDISDFKPAAPTWVLGACSLQGVHKHELYLVQLKF